MTPAVHVVVMAGGSGTRFWPLSRQARPKQLLSLGGKESLLAATFHRVATLAPPERWWMIVGNEFATACRAEVPEVPASQVLVEPKGRNTAPAIGLCAMHIARRDPDAILVVLPSDHHVQDQKALVAALETAAGLAARGPIVTLGIRPTRPDTGYGYIQRGAVDERMKGAYRVERFCEKPDLERAKGFLERGDFDWNAGIFVMRARTVLSELERQLPELSRGLDVIRDAIGEGKPSDVRPHGEAYEDTLRRVFPTLESVSIDYGVMEKALEVAVVPVSCGWSDVGSFAALDGLLARDADGNLGAGRHVAIDARNNVLYAEPGHVVAAVGVSGLAIIHTKDATLVVPVERAQEVRAVLERIKQQGYTEYL